MKVVMIRRERGDEKWCSCDIGDLPIDIKCRTSSGGLVRCSCRADEDGRGLRLAYPNDRMSAPIAQLESPSMLQEERLLG